MLCPLSLRWLLPMNGEEAMMGDRAELVEAALEVFPEAVVLLDGEERVVFWNRAAEMLTGYAVADVVGRPMPPGLEALAQFPRSDGESEPHNDALWGRGVLVHAQHKRGHDVPAMTQTAALRDGLGRRIGKAAVFHPGEPGNALPHGETQEGAETLQSVAEMEARLAFAFREFAQDQAPLGVLWITVDQAQELRKTHGARACETMLESVQRTLANGLRTGEEIGRWGDGDFLVLAREGDGPRLDAHARVLAGLARTADFHWWGDRISLTVSAGGAIARVDEMLAELVGRAQDAMLSSLHAGGNQTTLAAGRAACSPS
jgi:PAS domain S-box-containing protein